jgi:hypothetical protein
MDKNKLIKFLNLSTSSNDGEALSAIRKANIFLIENNLNWNTIFAEKSSPKRESDIQLMYWELEKTEQNFRETTKELESKLIHTINISRGLVIIILILIFVLILR